MSEMSGRSEGIVNGMRRSSTVGKMGIAGLGFDTVFNLAAGDNLGTSVMKAGVTGALVASNPVAFGIVTTGQMLADAGWGIAKYNYKQKNGGMPSLPIIIL